MKDLKGFQFNGVRTNGVNGEKPKKDEKNLSEESKPSETVLADSKAALSPDVVFGHLNTLADGTRQKLSIAQHLERFGKEFQTLRDKSLEVIEQEGLPLSSKAKVALAEKAALRHLNA